MKIIVIGGGPGGYVAAIRAAQLGAEVTVIEREHLGGAVTKPLTAMSPPRPSTLTSPRAKSRPRAA